MARVFDTTVRDGVLRAARPDTRWLSSGVDGGRTRADAAYNITVPEGWTETDPAAYAVQRIATAGFDADGPALLTGVAQRHARRAVCGPVAAIVTAGVSNPAVLPPNDASDVAADFDSAAAADTTTSDAEFRPGTINILLGTTRALDPGALTNLLAVAVEAKTATLTRETGFSGTTSDAVVVGSDPAGEPAAFTGSATTVGRAARACVRDALTAALAARYSDGEIPDSVADADYGTVTTETATVSNPTATDDAD